LRREHRTNYVHHDLNVNTNPIFVFGPRLGTRGGLQSRLVGWRDRLSGYL